MEPKIQGIRGEDKRYRSLDRTVLLSIGCARELWEKTAWRKGEEIGVNLGSSRGATALFERYYHSFLTRQTLSSQASPSTTLGNLSSWVAQDLQLQGAHFSHSITCATGLHAIANAIAWLQAGLSQKFIAGATEAPLTPFTLAQMKALGIYAEGKSPYPCQALNPTKRANAMVLSEGACLVALEREPTQKPLAWISGLGWATERIAHAVSITQDGEALFQSMKKAIGPYPIDEVDVIATHAPGTIAGDRAEYKAIQRLFGEDTPFLANNKWKIGHSLAASGLFNLESAIAMLIEQRVLQIPYLPPQKEPKAIRNALVNAMGFGGNAVSLLVSKA